MTAAPVFETARLLVRRITPADVDALLLVYGDADAMRFVGDGAPLTRTACAQWVEVTHQNYARRGYGMFAAVAQVQSEVIGFGGLVHPGGQPDAELKYALRRDAWGAGYATELARGLLAYGGSMLRLPRVIATVAPANTASMRVLDKAGMQRGDQRRNDDGSFTQMFTWDPVAPRS